MAPRRGRAGGTAEGAATTRIKKTPSLDPLLSPTPSPTRGTSGTSSAKDAKDAKDVNSGKGAKDAKAKPGPASSDTAGGGLIQPAPTKRQGTGLVARAPKRRRVVAPEATPCSRVEGQCNGSM